jgi:glycosyltransferase involved in cell wall biosynthesis
MKSKTNPKVLMIWTGNNNQLLGGVGHYRIVSPGNKLKELGYDITIQNGQTMDKDFRTNLEEEECVDVYRNMHLQYDIVWMKHSDNTAALSAIFGFKERYNTKIVWDFDDDLFAVKPGQPAWENYHPGNKNRAVVAAAISMCDALTVSTEPLKLSLQKLLKDVYNIVDKPIFVCPNFINPEEWNNVKYYPSNHPVIGYYGSTTHNEDLQMVMPSIIKVLEKYPLASFELIGACHQKDVIELMRPWAGKEVLDRIRTAGGLKGWEGFPELLLRQNWDISIAPLTDDTFNRAKSHIKWMESSMKSIPVVASDVYPYTTPIHKTPVIEHKKTGLISSDKDWFKHLSELIEFPELRVKLGKNAREAVLKNWSADKQIKHWKKALDSIIDLP